MDASSEITASASPDRVWTRQRAFAAVFSVALVAATLAPIAQNWRAAPQDAFPFSYYPMFSQKRGETYRANYVVGIDREGNRHPIPFTRVGGGGFNQVRRQIGRYLAEDDGDELARKVASRVARERRPPLDDVVTVEIVSGTFRFDNYFHGDKRPLYESVRGSAPVQRGPR